MSEVARNTWISSTSALIDTSMSDWTQRFRVQTFARSTASAIARTASNSPSRVRGEAGLDRVDSEVVEDPRDLELVRRSEGHARRLLPVPEGRVEDADPAAFHLFADGIVVRTHEHVTSGSFRWFHGHHQKAGPRRTARREPGPVPL